MNKLLIITIVCLSLLTGISQDLEFGLQGSYNFNGNINDLSQSNISGIGIYVNPTYGIEDIDTTAYLFNGESSYINLTNNSRNISDEVSISVWIKTLESNREFVISKYNSDEDKGYFVGINEGKAFVGGRDGSGNFWQINGNSLLNDGQWHHITAIIDKSEWSIYVNCTLENSLNTDTQNPQLNCNDPLTVGNWFQGNANGEHRFFSGIIDEFKIYNRALTSEEIELLCDLETVTKQEEIVDVKINVYPNPSSNFINIEQNEPSHTIFNYKLISSNGRILQSSGLKQKISLEGYATGIYYLLIYKDNILVKNFKLSKI